MKGNPWAFGLFFVLLVSFAVWNGFKIPTFFWGETETTKGVITNNEPVPFIGTNYRQMITYQYLVGDTVYSDRVKLGGRDRMKYVGTKIKVQFDTQNPEKNNIEKYYEALKPIVTKHTWNDSLVYEELLFYNDIVFVNKCTIYDELLSSEILEYVLVDDYVILVPLFHTERKEQRVLRRFDIEVDQFDQEVLVERDSRRVFK